MDVWYAKPLQSVKILAWSLNITKPVTMVLSVIQVWYGRKVNFDAILFTKTETSIHIHVFVTENLDLAKYKKTDNEKYQEALKTQIRNMKAEVWNILKQSARRILWMR